MNCIAIFSKDSDPQESVKCEQTLECEVGPIKVTHKKTYFGGANGYQNKPSISRNSNKFDSSSNTQEEVHINLIRVNTARKSRCRFRKNHNDTTQCFLDLGLMIKSSTELIKIYLPFKIKDTEGPTLDLGGVLKDRTTLCAIFNDDMVIDQCDNNCYTKVKHKSQNDFFYIYQLNMDNIETIQSESSNDGTMILIKGFDTLKIESTEKYYLRFRFEIEDISAIAKTKDISNDFVQSAFSSTDLFDIRINEHRQLPDKLIEKMLDGGFRPMTFSKVHLFYITSTNEEIINGSSLKSDCRMLESNCWGNYLPNCIDGKDVYLAHHWKKRQKENESPIKSASFFFYSVYPSDTIKRKLGYASALVAFGALGSEITSFLQELGDNYVCLSWLKHVIIIIILAVALVVINKLIQATKK